MALKAHTVPCTCDAVNLSAIFAGVSPNEHEGTIQGSAFSTIFHKKK